MAFLAIAICAFLSTAVPTAHAAAAAGPRVVKIIFKAGGLGGSFDAAPTNGTLNVPGSGHRAVRLFNGDGSLLAQGGSSSPTWPKWIDKIEVGISGSNNLAATRAECARFNTSGETNAKDNVHFPGPASMFRVSEVDCAEAGSTTAGNGGPGDGVFIRVTLVRNSSYLAPTENVLAVLEYAPAGWRPAPTNPKDCFFGGNFTPEKDTCADHVWRIYLKHNDSEVVQSYLMLSPPTYQLSGPMTKQFYLPLAADASLRTIQISRTFGSPASAALDTACGAAPSNSPFCSGMVFYSLTLIRI